MRKRFIIIALRYNKKDLTGVKFNMVTAIEELEERRGNHVMWRCVCECGNEFVARGASLKSGNTKSCGCLTRKIKEGQRYGKLIVVERVGTDKFGSPEWFCNCDCGGTTVLSTGAIRSGNSKSCGCLSRNDMLTTEERIKGRNILSGATTNITYDTWRRRVLEKDGYVCQCCDTVGIDIEAHHLDGWDWCEYRRFDLSNGIALCSACHLLFHKKYGRGGNTSFQYYEFKQKFDQLNRYEAMFS